MKKTSNNKPEDPDFRKLFESAPGLYLVLSPDLKILAASDAYLKATMTEREQIMGKGLFTVFPDNPDDPTATGVGNLHASLDRVLKTKLPDAMAVQKYDIQRPVSEGDGFEVRYWSPLNSPVLSADNKKVKYIIHRVEDVTEFVRLKQEGTEQIKITEELRTKAQKMENEVFQRAQQLQETNKKLRETEQIKNEFFTNVSHELRTPLSLILAPLESLLADGDEEISLTGLRLLRTIHNNTIRLLQMVNGLLDFAKFEAGKMKAEPSPTDVPAVVNSILSDFEPAMKAKKIEVSCEIDTPGSYFMLDRYLFERILFNLISNAVKFTFEGGKINVHLKSRKGKLILEIEDSGIGIPPSEIPHLFQKFRQVEGSSTRRYEGTGLGLAMVKEFAELLGGSVSINSTLGKGSVFTVKLPAVASGAVPETTQFKMPHAPLSPQYQTSEYTKDNNDLPEEEDNRQLKMLICEDNEELAVYIVSLLRDMCRIKTAHNGEEGLRLVQTWAPDLVLSDVMMPEKDGLELCKAIKQNPQTANIIVVLLTALTHREAMLKGWEAKADEYLFKPFHPEELVTRVRTLLSVISDRKKAAEVIEKKDLQLSKANAELEAFSYSVSHDLRSPLRVIGGFAQILAKEYGHQLDDEARNSLDVIKNTATRMSILIDDLLKFAQVDKELLIKLPADMNKMVAEVARDVKVQNQNLTADIKLHDLPVSNCDFHLLQQVWANLISNAMKYSAGKKAAQIEIGGKEEDGQLIYYVKDNGVGFDMKHYDKLFGAFQRLHKSTEFEGTGVGLALVQRIISRHGGKVWAVGKENKGATFYFSLPATETPIISKDDNKILAN